MPSRLAVLALALLCIPIGVSPLASAQPPAADGGSPPPPPPGAVPSGIEGYLKTPDGWDLKVSGEDETQVAVAPLTTALSSREYLVGGTFKGSMTGSGKTKITGGTLEAGYRIGCGIIGGPVELQGSAGMNPQFGATGVLSQVAFPVTGQIKINLRPGTVTVVPVSKKEFKGNEGRVTITGFRVKVDGCVGQSFLQSYATIVGSTEDTDDVISYYGPVKVV